MSRSGVQSIARGILLPLASLFFALLVAAAHGQQGGRPSLEDEINGLMARGQFADAYDLAQRGWGPDTPNRAARLDFIKAMSLKAQGRYAEAIEILRRLNADNPSFTRVRAELAHALFLVGDHDAAQFHFTDLHRNAGSDQMRESFDAYLAAIRSQRPYRLGAYVSIAPSTNINNRTSTRQIMVNGLPFVLDADSRARSGVGLSGGVSGERSFLFGDNVTLTLAGRFDGTKYEHKEFDKFTLNGSAFLRRRAGRDTFGAGVIADYQNEGHSTYRHGIGGALEYGRIFDGGRHLFASVRLMSQTFPDTPVLDGYQVSAHLIGRQTLGPGHHLTAGLRFTAERTRADHHDYDGAGLFVAHSREWKGGLITQIEPSVAVRRYHAADPVFGIRRRDTELGATVRLMHRKLNYNGFAPRLEYSYTHQFSNHPLQERDTHAVNVVMTREF